MQRTDVDGVPVFWRQGPEPLTATLLFRVGRRDETFLNGDITHLVEHLVMRAHGRTHLDFAHRRARDREVGAATRGRVGR